MNLKEDLAIFEQLDDERLAEIAFPAAASLTQDGLYSGSRLDKIKAAVADIRSSGSEMWKETITVLNDNTIRGDISIALVLIPMVSRALGLEGAATSEVIALALLMARLRKH